MRTNMTPSCLNCASLDRVFMEIIPCRPQHAVGGRLIPTGTGFFSVSELTQYTRGHVCTCMLMKEGDGNAAQGADTVFCLGGH